MANYQSHEEMQIDTKDLTPAQLIDALYSRMADPNSFGDKFAADQFNGIVYTRLTNSFAQEVVRLLMSCVRADAEMRKNSVSDSIEIACLTVSDALEEARRNQGRY